ncbi:hypothetical protein AAP_03497 [Ascosphaera apis ARSEF 7405]|uniref:DNA-directed RNA polymerase III subunit RPC9 n=1 Tax=Ascosphaera apis ARSEF 7405 TaxID=392613 RepID=A0A167YGY2_9EURO|nr:hypothetical protein AAP_03497 [Ascosphaera apis ARSEF 7405]
MKILQPQSAVLSNVEVLAHIAQYPPRKPPQPPQNVVNFVPNPDLRDHNTVIKEFHNYVTRLSPHLLSYPAFNPSQSNIASFNAINSSNTPSSSSLNRSSEPTPLDLAIRKLILELKPFGLTKAEVLMILNLGVGLKSEPVNEDGEGDVQMGEGEGGAVEQDGQQDVEGEMEEGGDEDYGALALLDTVIEDREERLSDDDIIEILKIIRGALGPVQG